MKKLLLIASLLFAIVPAALGAAPTKVQSKSCIGLTVSSLNCSLPSNVTAGNYVGVWVGTGSSAGGTPITVGTPTMTGETVVAVAGASNGGTSTNGQVAYFEIKSAVGGQAQVSVSISGAGAPADIHVHIVELNGQAATPVDATGNTESTTLSVSTSASTTTANDYVLSFMYDNANNRTFTAGAGYTQVEQTNDSTNGDAGFSESKTVSATGTQTATASGNSGDKVEQGIVAVAGSSGGGGGTTPPPAMMTMGVGFLATNINQPAIDGFQGCIVGDTTCAMEAQLCDENGNCLHFPPGKHTLTVSFTSTGANPTPVASAQIQVTAR